MPATSSDRIGHIKDAIANIRSLRARAADEQIKLDPILRAALERFFEIISEASRHVPEELRQGTLIFRGSASQGSGISCAMPMMASTSTSCSTPQALTSICSRAHSTTC